jgi:hypothetical protein
MGVRTSLIAASLAAGHNSAAFAHGRSAPALVLQAEQQLLDTIQLLREIVKDMQNGDPNIASFSSLITQLS